MDVITPEMQDILDSDIREKSKISDSDIREYPLSVIKEKFTNGLEKEESELFVPDYQREFVWSEIQKSRFIESLLMNLPIPYIFAGDVAEGDDAGRLEIIDGSQRVRTIVEFLEDKFTLCNLKKITAANGFKFSNFSRPTQLRFGRKTVRIIELTQYADEETRREIFDRLNTGGQKLVNMEQRRGSEDGPFLNFIEMLSDKKTFKEICPLSDARVKRREYTELVLRFFAYSDNYLEFKKSVDVFLTDYLKEKNEQFDNEVFEREFDHMCNFISSFMPHGFRKSSNSNSVPRIRFEALSVGSMLALRVDPDLQPNNVENWLNSERFVFHTRSDASNSRPKVKARIEYVRNMLLGLDEGVEL